MKKSTYKVKRRASDGRMCIYTQGYDAVIAEFVNGAAVDAKNLKAILEEHAKRTTTAPPTKPTTGD